MRFVDARINTRASNRFPLSLSLSLSTYTTRAPPPRPTTISLSSQSTCFPSLSIYIQARVLVYTYA